MAMFSDGHNKRLYYCKSIWRRSAFDIWNSRWSMLRLWQPCYEVQRGILDIMFVLLVKERSYVWRLLEPVQRFR